MFDTLVGAQLLNTDQIIENFNMVPIPKSLLCSGRYRQVSMQLTYNMLSATTKEVVELWGNILMNPK